MPLKSQHLGGRRQKKIYEFQVRLVYTAIPGLQRIAVLNLQVKTPFGIDPSVMWKKDFWEVLSLCLEEEEDPRRRQTLGVNLL